MKHKILGVVELQICFITEFFINEIEVIVCESLAGIVEMRDKWRNCEDVVFRKGHKLSVNVNRAVPVSVVYNFPKFMAVTVYVVGVIKQLRNIDDLHSGRLLLRNR